MKLYAWKPNGHGQISFFVMAESKEKAQEAVDAYIKKHLDQDDNDEFLYDYHVDGWGDDSRYNLEVKEAGQVAINYND